MGHRYVPLPFTAARIVAFDWPWVTVAQEHLSARVNVESGETETRKGGAPPLEERRAPIAGVAARTEETDAGPVCTLEGPGLSVAIEGDVFRGSFDGALLVALAQDVRGRWQAVGAAGETSLVLPAGERPSARGRWVICPTLSLAHRFERREGALRALTVPTPGTPLDAAESEGRAAVLAVGKLVVLELDALDRSARHASTPLTLEPLQAVSTDAPTEAEVLFAFPGSFVVEHPEHGRITVRREPGGPEVEPGDVVLLEDVREDLPGVFRVHAWRPSGARTSERPAAATLELPAPVLPEPPPPEEATAAELRALAAAHGFEAPPLLLRLLEEREREPAFARWLDQCGFAYFELRGLTADWDADPCLLAFAGGGGGDELCLHVYPPAGSSPAVVEFFHEDGTVERRDADFAAFFDAELEARAAWADPRLVQRIRDRLALPAGSTSKAAPPAVADDEERALVARLRDGDLDALDALAEIYEARGWTLALAHVREALGE